MLFSIRIFVNTTQMRRSYIKNSRGNLALPTHLQSRLAAQGRDGVTRAIPCTAPTLWLSRGVLKAGLQPHATPPPRKPECSPLWWERRCAVYTDAAVIGVRDGRPPGWADMLEEGRRVKPEGNQSTWHHPVSLPPYILPPGDCLSLECQPGMTRIT